MSEADDLAQEYDAYLARFDDAVGPCAIGAFAKHGGRLVKRFHYAEFELAYLEYRALEQAYMDSMSRGDTINDVVVKLMRDKSVDLFLRSPG